MKQMFLKSSFSLGWGSADYRIGLAGDGNTPLAITFGADYVKAVIPVAGVFSNLTIYAPAGAHPNFTATVMINGVASTVSCALTSGAVLASSSNSVSVVAGDDIYISINVNPFGSGAGYPLNLSLEFEATQQFYPISTTSGGQTVGTYITGGALGNGVSQVLSVPTQLSNTHSISALSGTLTGIRVKNYFAGNVGGGYTIYLTKNQVLQDGSAGTVNTACSLPDGTQQATSGFSLPIAVGDHLDFAILRTGSSGTFGLANVTASTLFTPDNTSVFMCIGGNANSYTVNPDFVWMASQQNIGSNDIAKCPIGPQGITVRGLYIECPAPAITADPTKNRVFTILKNGIVTAATVTVAGLATTGLITGQEITFNEGDYLSLGIVNSSGALSGNGLYWGLLSSVYTDRSGLYFVNAPGHDNYYGDISKKIPNPTIRTALIGE